MRKIGQINCIEVSSINSSADNQLIILFHGYGADAYDLQTLSDEIHLNKSTDWLFPQGPLEVPIGPGWLGRAWWQINIQAIQEAAMRGEDRDMANEKPKELEKLRKTIFDFISKTNVPTNQIVLGGFSQGAMLATDIFLNSEVPFKGLVILSGALICKDEWKNLVTKKRDTKFFQCHGLQDAVLSHKGAARLETLLTQGGMKGKLISFNGGHEIPLPIINQLTDFLNKL